MPIQRRAVRYHSYVVLSGLLAPVALSPAAAQKAPPISADRPGFTNSTDTVPPGFVQLEGGYTFSQAGTVKQHTLGEWLLRVPVGSATEVRLGVPSYNRVLSPGGNSSGFGDLSLGVKQKLVMAPEHVRIFHPAVTLIASTTVPTGAPAFREPHLQPMANLEFSWNVSDRVNVGASLDDTYASQNGQQFNQFAYSASAGYSFNSRWSTFGEFFSLVPGSPSGPNSNNLDGGIMDLVGNNTQLDVNGGIGLNGINPEYFVGAGIAHRW